MFKIKNLQVSIDNKRILKDFNIDINPGELHVIMGPNGSGKSTLTNAIAGKETHSIDKGEMTPKMSIVRKVVMRNHHDLIESIYN